MNRKKEYSRSEKEKAKISVCINNWVMIEWENIIKLEKMLLELI